MNVAVKYHLYFRTGAATVFLVTIIELMCKWHGTLEYFFPWV